MMKSFEEYHKEMEAERQRIKENTTESLLDVEGMEKRIEEKRKEQTEAFYENLKTTTLEARKERDYLNWLRAKGAQQEQEEQKKQMEIEITREQALANKAIREKYEKQYGSHSWNRDEGLEQAYSEMANTAFGNSEVTTLPSEKADSSVSGIHEDDPYLALVRNIK